MSLVPSALPSPTKVQTSRKVPTPRQKRVEASRKNQKVKKPVAEVIKKTESSRREPNESPKVLRSRAVSPVISTREEPDTSRHEKKYKVSVSLSLSLSFPPSLSFSLLCNDVNVLMNVRLPRVNRFY